MNLARTACLSLVLTLAAAPAALANEYIAQDTNGWLKYSNGATAEITNVEGGWRLWSEFAGWGPMWVYTASGYDYFWIWDGNTYQLVANLSGPVGEVRTGRIPPCNYGQVKIASRGSLTTPAGRFDDVTKLTLVSSCADAGTTAIWFAKGVGVVKWTAQSFMGEQTVELTSAYIGGRSYPAASTPAPAPTSARAVAPSEHADMETILWGCNDTYLVVDTYTDAFRGLDGSGVGSEVIVGSDYVASQLRYEMTQASVPLDDVEILVANVDSVWMRDYGPIVLKTGDGTRSVADLNYYPGRPRDDRIPGAYAGYRGWSTVHVDISYEGGNFATDGRGKAFSSLGVQWFNRDKSVSQIEREFRKMGCDDVVYVEPLIDEGTTHIDMFARVMSDDTALVSRYPSSHRQARVVDAAARAFQAEGYRVVRVDADHAYDEYATYSNSVLANGVALIPQYANSTKNRNALAAYRDLGFRAVGVDSQLIIKYSGATHCVSMQIPRGR